MKKLALAALLLLAALPAAAQVATVVTDSTAEFRVVAQGGDLSLPAHGQSTVRQIFRLYEGDQATIAFTIKAKSPGSGWLDFTDPLVVWTSTDTTAVKVYRVGPSEAQVEAQPGAADRGARVHLTIVMPGFKASEGNEIALFYHYYYPGKYRCERLVAPPFLSTYGRGVYSQSPDYEDQLKGLEGCALIEPPAATDSVYASVGLTEIPGAGETDPHEFRVDVNVLDADGAPLPDREITAEVISGAWGDGSVGPRIRMSGTDGAARLGAIRYNTELRITVTGSRVLTISSPAGT